MPIKDEELRKIIKILVDKDKDKKARKKARKKRRRATGGGMPAGGMPATAQTGLSSAGMAGFGGVNYWGSGGGGGGGGALGPTRQEIQNLIQSNLTTPPAPLFIPAPPQALPPSLADENIFKIAPANILTQEQEMVLEPAKWTMDEIEADTYGNFAPGTGSDQFVEAGGNDSVVSDQFVEAGGNDSVVSDAFTAGDLTENYPPFASTPIAPASASSDYMSSGYDTEFPSFIKTKNEMPSIPEDYETPKPKRKYTRKTPEEKAIIEEQKALRKLKREQRRSDELKAFPELAKYPEVMDDAVRNQNLSKLNQGKK